MRPDVELKRSNTFHAIPAAAAAAHFTTNGHDKEKRAKVISGNARLWLDYVRC